jgi:hypothetical protein
MIILFWILIVIYILVHGFMLLKLTNFDFQGNYDEQTNIIHSIFPYTALSGFFIISGLSILLLK